MSFDYFWYNADQIRSHPDNIAFSVFSLSHIIWLVIIIIFIILYCRFYLKGDDKRRRNMRCCLALFMIFSEIAKMCLMDLTGATAHGYLPLEICSLAEYMILIDSMWPDKDIIHQMLLFAFLPGGLMALAFPGAAGSYTAFNIFTIRFFLFHGGIVAYVIARYMVGEIKPRYRGLWMSLAITFVIGLIMQRFDLSFGFNFMFLTDPQGNPMLKLIWDISGGNGGMPYLCALTVFVCLVMHVMYLVYRFIENNRVLRQNRQA